MTYSREDLVNEFNRNENVVALGDAYSITFDSEVLMKTVPVRLDALSGDPNNDISEYMVSCLNMVFQFDSIFLQSLKEAIWRHYCEQISNTAYNFVPQSLIDKHNGNDEKANKEYFGFGDQDDTYAAANISNLFVEGDESMGPCKMFAMFFEVPWENEHGICVEVVDGKISEVL